MQYNFIFFLNVKKNALRILFPNITLSRKDTLCPWVFCVEDTFLNNNFLHICSVYMDIDFTKTISRLVFTISLIINKNACVHLGLQSIFYTPLKS